VMHSLLFNVGATERKPTISCMKLEVNTLGAVPF
jgi:hypothetical protein